MGRSRIRQLIRNQNTQRTDDRAGNKSRKEDCGKIHKNKALWKIINKEIGNSHPVSNIITNTGAKIITNPQTITERFNIYLLR